MKRLNGAGTRALATVREFTVAQRTIALIGIAVLLLGGFALANVLGKPTYSPLYTGLSGTDASAIVAQLEKDKVPYEYADGGATILVPASSVDAERVAAASAGLPSSSTGGYSLLDKMGVTASQFQQDVTYKRAIEGELAKTIQSIDGVSAASVMLAIPQQTVFTDSKEDPTASVFVTVLTPLTSDQVGAIVHLVSAAYPGLTDANVTVADQKGNVLSSAGGVSGSGSDQAATYEASTKANVQAMLDKVLGPGNATVTVAADVSRSSGTKKTQQYTTPSQAPVLSESSNDQSYSGAGASGAGTSGVLGNDTTSTSTTSGSSSGSGNGSYKSTQGVKNNAVDSTTTDETIVPGTLNRQTIAVAVNSSSPTASQVSQTVVQSLVTQAAGVNTTRGDAVTVQFVPFSNAAAKQAASALAQSQKDAGSAQMMQLITTAIQVVGGLVFFVLVMGLLKKLFKRQEPQPLDGGVINIVPGTPGATPGDPMLVGAGMPGQLGGYAGAPASFGLPSGTAPTQVMATSVADPAYLQMQADVDALAGADPEQTAEYLRALMGDRTKA